MLFGHLFLMSDYMNVIERRALACKRGWTGRFSAIAKLKRLWILVKEHMKHCLKEQMITADQVNEPGGNYSLTTS